MHSHLFYGTPLIFHRTLLLLPDFLLIVRKLVIPACLSLHSNCGFQPRSSSAKFPKTHLLFTPVRTSRLPWVEQYRALCAGIKLPSALLPLFGYAIQNIPSFFLASLSFRHSYWMQFYPALFSVMGWAISSPWNIPGNWTITVPLPTIPSRVPCPYLQDRVCGLPKLWTHPF